MQKTTLDTYRVLGKFFGRTVNKKCLVLFWEPAEIVSCNLLMPSSIRNNALLDFGFGIATCYGLDGPRIESW
jgi:hypothetical protein